MTAMQVYGEKGWQIVANGNYRDIDDPVARARAFARHIEDKSGELWKHGCLLGSLTLELAESHPKLIRKINELFENLETEAGNIFTPALAARKVKHVNGKDLGRQFLAVIEGSIVIAKAHEVPAYLKEGIRHFAHYLDFILDR